MRVELIAECASNHGGNIPLAKEFIHRFAEAGADWIKFQTTRVKHLRPDDPQYAWFKQAELSDEAHYELKAECEQAGVKFLTTIYNRAELPLIQALGMDTLKLGSGEQRDGALARAAEGLGLRVLRSIHHLGSDRWWIEDIEDEDDNDIGEILSCVTRYPASERACLEAIRWVNCGSVVGYSDHSIGTDMACWAMDCGARIIEKHVSLEHQARPVQVWEATPAEFKWLRKYADEDPARFEGRWQYA